MVGWIGSRNEEWRMERLQHGICFVDGWLLGLESLCDFFLVSSPCGSFVPMMVMVLVVVLTDPHS